MFRADSERSLCDSDENVMEGGVTIKQRVEQRQPVSLIFICSQFQRGHYLVWWARVSDRFGVRVSKLIG